MPLKSTLPIKAVQIYGDKGGNELVSIKTDQDGKLLTTTEVQVTIPSFESQNFYYNSSEITPLTNVFQQFSFNFTSIAIFLVNDSSNYIEFSFDGINVHGKVFKKEILVFDRIAKTGIYLRGQAGGEAYRLWAW